jgi:glycosyltransferase involved in cell wall biosynthesis
MIESISAVIITKNAAATLTETLNSLKSFKEVVVLDNGSQDSTEKIARNFDNVIFHIDTFEGFGPTKNKAVSLASNDWVFSLDADEVLSDELIKEVQNWDINNTSMNYGIVLRENYFMGKAIHHGGWGNDKLVRLFNRQAFLFNDASVHESVDVDKKISNGVTLSGVIKHNAVQHLGQLLQKVDRYSELRKDNLIVKNKIYPPIIIILKTIFAFIRSYLLQLGFLAGWRGLVIAYSNANGVFFKYMKAYSQVKS